MIGPVLRQSDLTMGAGASASAQDLPDTLDRAQCKAFAGEAWEESRYRELADDQGHVTKATVIALIESGAFAFGGGSDRGSETLATKCGEITMSCVPCSGPPSRPRHAPYHKSRRRRDEAAL